MAKQKFTVTADCRINKKHVAAGSKVELDPSNKDDYSTLSNLLGSDRIVETDKALEAMQKALEPAKASPEPPPAPKPAASAPASAKKS
jgi:hypothetical protein